MTSDAPASSASSPPPDSEGCWSFLSRKGSVCGPITTLQLQRFWALGAVRNQTLVWKTGMPQWQEASSLPELEEVALEEIQNEKGNLGRASFVDRSGVVFHYDAVVDEWIPEVGVEEEKQPEYNPPLLEEEEEELGLYQRRPVHEDTNTEEKKDKDESADPPDPFKISQPQEGKKRKKEKAPTEWFEMKNNTFVYFAGVPPDTTEEEIAEWFSKCGIIKLDDVTAEPRVKLYKNDDGSLKGDGLVCFLKDTSVSLACTIRDGAEFRPGWVLEVKPAVFHQKGSEYIPLTKKKKKRSKKRIQEQQERNLQWTGKEELAERGLVGGHRIMIMKNLFSLEDLLSEPTFPEDLRDDIQSECSKFGPIEKVTVFKKHPAGVVRVKFKDHIAAKKAIEVMNERYFAKRKIHAEFWDGVSKYNAEDEEDEEKRLERFGKELEAQS